MFSADLWFSLMVLAQARCTLLSLKSHCQGSGTGIMTYVFMRNLYFPLLKDKNLPSRADNHIS